MRNPIWKWTKWISWLSVGVSGCLHGSDWRAAVSKPLTQPVADRRESLPQPKFVGPRRSKAAAVAAPANSRVPTVVATSPNPSATPVVRGPRVVQSKDARVPVGHLMPSAITAHPPALTAAGLESVSRIASEPLQPPTTQDEAQPRGAKVVVTEFVPPPAPPAALPVAPPSPVAVPPSTPATIADDSAVPAPPPAASLTPTPTHEGFAEFERSIPIKKSIVTQTPALPEKHHEINVTVTPDPDPEPEPRRLPALPVITPAATSVGNAFPVDPRPAPSVSAKELPDVSDTNLTAPETHSTAQEHSARPRDVALLIEQVFEDLRQRRLDDARQRTQWLKQLVTKRLPNSDAVSIDALPVDFDEPPRLQVDPRAMPVEAGPSEVSQDDETSTICP